MQVDPYLEEGGLDIAGRSNAGKPVFGGRGELYVRTVDLAWVNTNLPQKKADLSWMDADRRRESINLVRIVRLRRCGTSFP
jgi:hypothetical protein